MDKQHYVPQHYLKNFSTRDRLFFFHKEKGFVGSKGANVKSILKAEGFYNIHEKAIRIFLIEENTEPKILDSLIREYNENILAPFLKSLADYWKHALFWDERVVHQLKIRIYDLYDFIIIQLLRTPKFRAHLKKGALKIEEQSESVENREKRINVIENDEGFIRSMHNIILLSALEATDVWKDLKGNKSLFKAEYQNITTIGGDIVKSLKDCTCFMYVAKGSLNFKTSDHPVSILHNDDRSIGDFHFLYIPLSNKVAFIFMDKEEYPSIINFHQRMFFVDESNKHVVENLNLLTTREADTFVYSKHNDFELEKEFIALRKELNLDIFFREDG